MVMESSYSYTELRGIAGSSPVLNTEAITNGVPMFLQLLALIYTKFHI